MKVKIVDKNGVEDRSVGLAELLEEYKRRFVLAPGVRQTVKR
jgi:hypothetical protein